MNEKEQAKVLLSKLQQLRHDNVEFKSLWRALGDCCETLNERIRVLELQERKSLLKDLSDPEADVVEAS